MKEILILYLNNCDQAMIHENELNFDFSEYHCVFTFNLKDKYEEKIDEDFYSYNNLDDISKIDHLIIEISEFTSFEIKGHEYLGWRENLTQGKSITYEMYSIIKKISSYRKNGVLNYYTDIKYGDPMCPDEGNYIFRIEIAEELWWDFEFVKNIIEDTINPVEVPDFYTVFFRKNIPVKDDKKLPLLSTNTKVRRLGYFKILASFLEEYKQIPASFINKKFEIFCSKYINFLKKNEFTKGIIRETKSGISAKPYIETATEIELLNKINNTFNIGKSFKVYQSLKAEYSASSNIFELTTFDKIFFLENILRYDYFYFSNLLELIFIEDRITYSNIINLFHDKLISCLEDYKRQNQYSFEGYKSTTYHVDRKVVSKIDVVLKRIQKWEKADVYLEHIIMPRLNWMLDLGIITYDSLIKQYSITKVGLKLFKHNCIWNDINTEKVISPNIFLNSFMIHLFDDCYNNVKVSNPANKKVILENLFKHLEISFSLFKTLAPNRVTASQAANYAKYKLYLEDNIKVGYNFILNQLSEKEQDKFIFKFQEQYQDGYIQLKK